MTAAPVTRHIDNAMVKAIARAFRWREMLESGEYATIREIATAEKINESYVGRVLRLTLLAPDIVEAILDGRQPVGLQLRLAESGFRWSGTSNGKPSACKWRFANHDMRALGFIGFGWRPARLSTVTFVVSRDQCGSLRAERGRLGPSSTTGS